MAEQKVTWVRDTRSGPSEGVIRGITREPEEYEEPVDHLNKPPAAKAATPKEK